MVCFFLKCVSYRHWQPLGFECGAKLGKIKQTLKLVLQNISILWIKFELSVMSLAPRGQKTGSKSPSTTSGRFHRAAVHRFSCCLIRLSSVLLAASGGKPSVPLRWAQLVLCDGRQLSVAMSHARRDKSPCFGVLFSLYPQHWRHTSTSNTLFESTEKNLFSRFCIRVMNNLFLNYPKKDTSIIFLLSALWLYTATVAVNLLPFKQNYWKLESNKKTKGVIHNVKDNKAQN